MAPTKIISVHADSPQRTVPWCILLLDPFWYIALYRYFGNGTYWMIDSVAHTVNRTVFIVPHSFYMIFTETALLY